MALREATVTVDTDLLREQLEALIAYNGQDGSQPSVEIVDGLIGLCEGVLDSAERVR